MSEEVKKAVKRGYVIKRVYEIWQYEMTQCNREERKGGAKNDGFRVSDRLRNK